MIVYFSGTGNTRHCAAQLSRLTGDELFELDPDELSRPGDILLDTSDGHIVWAFPTYAWGVPPVMERFMSEVVLGEKAMSSRHYMLTTCGDDMGYTDRQWRKIMLARGLDVAGAYAVVMPNTYTLMPGFDVDSRELAHKKMEESRGRIALIAKAMEEGRGDLLVRGAFPWIKSKIYYPLFKRFCMSPEPFHTTEACTACGLCSQRCPLGNISPGRDKTPVWGSDCALCLRCYHSCPRHAIAYGSRTSGKGQWLCRK